MMQFRTRLRGALVAVAGVALLALWLAPHAWAQTDDRLASLSISVWPEYDKPSVLVTYEGEVASKDPLPRTVSVFIPSTAEVNAVAYVANNGDLLNTDPPTFEDPGDGTKRISFKLPATKFHIEFYYNPLQGAPDKTMEFVYKAAQSADNVQIELQQPLNATKFTTDPASQFQSTDAHKFTYHIFSYASVTQGQTLKIKASYTRSDPNPSIDSLPKPSSTSTAPEPSTPAAGDPTTLVAAALIAVALALIALAAYYWWSRNHKSLEPVQVSAGRSRRRGNGQQSGGAAGGFCTNCGRVLTADDNFCPRCGTKRRV